ncbi:transglutaminase-like domain-containing protein [Phocaeicola oris]|uniref:transglutaminase-like domain-containing protein n=1 Tax=Phocaeicola oris TaxID=2896850 RepID=UPI00234EC0C9|nr:transglutaminase domain-containing protein [Phocaeicola oris]MCE2617479.1 transglutaminase domain-containing protein [Phocaeicola oris]
MKHILYLICIFFLASCARQENNYAYSWEEDLHQRLLTDFCQTESNVKDYIKKYIPHVTDEQMRQWETSGALECRIIDGQKRYFIHAAPNLFRIDSICAHIKQEKDGIKDDFSVEQENMQSIITSVIKTDSTFVQPKRIRVTYMLTVDKDAVPTGKIIRCWLPYPRQDIARQQNVKFISASEKQYILSPSEYMHSTLYMEKVAKAGEPTIFQESFEYTSWGEWHNLDASMIQPYDTTAVLYKKFTSERDKHIVFTPRLRQLAEKLTAGIHNPYEKALTLFRWINQFPWASAREYSTIENISEYVLENKHGDCGQVTLLFLTLCRICGIPAHFQSGFMMHPGSWNLHDWGEIYFEGIGWVPVDQSFGIEPFAKTQQEKDFFVGGIDSWRMVVNNDFGLPFYPEKKYPRSETVDFQRGEVEWEGGNLYFPQWNYQMQIEYLN